MSCTLLEECANDLSKEMNGGRVMYTSRGANDVRGVSDESPTLPKAGKSNLSIENWRRPVDASRSVSK